MPDLEIDDIGGGPRPHPLAFELSVNTASDHTPDDAALVDTLARRFHAPVDVVRQYKHDYMGRASAEDAVEATRHTPKLREYLSQQNTASIMQDDVATLAAMETSAKPLGRGGAIMRPDPIPSTPWNIAKGLGHALPDAIEGTVQGLRQQIGGLFGFSDVVKDAERRSGFNRGERASVTPTFESSWGAALYSGGVSTMDMLPGLAASLLTRSRAPLLGIMGLMTEAEAYDRYKVRGGTSAEAFLGAMTEGSVEVATEFLSMGFLMKNLGNVGMGTMLKGYLGQELPSEIIADILQSATDTAIANPEKSWGEWVRERPEALFQTAIATLVPTAFFGVLHGAALRVQPHVKAVDEATKATATMSALATLAKVSKTRERSDDVFMDFVESVTEGAPTVELSADALEQSGLVEEAMALSPSIRAQYPLAREQQHKDIVIPTAEYLSKIAPTDVGDALFNDLKVPLDSDLFPGEAITGRQAKDYVDRQSEEFSTLIAGQLAQHLERKDIDESSKVVGRKILDQLKGLPAIDDQAAKDLSVLHRAMYDTMALKSGVLPNTLYEAIPLSIQQTPQLPKGRLFMQAAIAGADQNNPTETAEAARLWREQGTESPYFKRWFGDSKVVDKAGKPLVVYHGTDAEFSVFSTPSWFAGRQGEINNMPARYRAVRQGRGFDEKGDTIAINEVEGTLGRASRSRLAAEENRILGAREIPVYISLRNPVEYRGKNVHGITILDARKVSKLTSKGYDGAISYYEDGTIEEVVAFSPTQIKSATANTGAFDPNDPSILHQGEVSTRVPSAVNITEDPLGQTLTIDYPVALSDLITLGKNVKVMLAGPDLPRLTGVGARDPVRNAEAIVEHMAKNLLFLYDSAPLAWRERATQWYDGGRKMIEAWGQRYGISEAQGAASIAVLSPQNGWFPNVSAAERILDIIFGMRGFRWDDKMTAEAARITAGESDEFMEAAKDLTLNEVLSQPNVAARWVRVYDQTHNNRAYRTLTPEGGAAGLVTIASGSEATMAWKSYSTIAKAISIITDGRNENIFFELGSEHKVRSFYNNLLTPDSPFGFTTIDTHAVAAARLRPLSASDVEVNQAFGSFGAASSSRTGLNGTYPLYVEAYRRAATARGVLPRQMQSVTWEAVRGLFEAAKKSRLKEHADAIWTRYKHGDINQAQAQSEILSLAQGITDPSWVNVPVTDTVERTYTGPAQAVIDARGGQPLQPQQSTFVMTEVAPDPNDVELTARWNALTAAQQAQISQHIINIIVPQILAEAGTSGELVPQIGGYLGATNVSFALSIDRQELAVTVARLLGHALSQDGMMVISSKPVLGTTPHGAVSITLPDGYGLTQITELYAKLHELQHNGKPLITGHSTVAGHMLILNDSGLTNEAVQHIINTHLDNQFIVDAFSVHAAFLVKESYNYASKTRDKGSSRRSSDSSRAHHFREEASKLLRAAIEQPAGSEPTGEAGPRTGLRNTQTDRLHQEAVAAPLLQQASVSTFYSHALNVLEDKMPARASVEQIRGILSPENGVKADELKWLGLDLFLQTQAQFTKDEVLAFVRENQVQVEEVEKGQDKAHQAALADKQAATAPARAARNAAVRTAEAAYEAAIKTARAAYDAAAGPAQAFLAEVIAPAQVAYHATLAQAQVAYDAAADTTALAAFDAAIAPARAAYNAAAGPAQVAYNAAKATAEAAYDAAFNTAWAAYKAAQDTAEAAYDAAAGPAIAASRKNGPTKFSSYQLPGGTNYGELLLTFPAQEDAFIKGHWNESNVLAHVRFNDRKGPKGKKVLFLEEVQSDWHQKGRDKGYRGPVGRSARDSAKAFDESMVEKYGDEKRAFSESSEDELDHRKKLYELAIAEERAASMVSQASMVPDSPFKKTWHELAMKRMLRYAAEHGYDTLAWTVGSQQIERYEATLRQNVDEIGWDATRVWALKNKQEVFTGYVDAKTGRFTSGEADGKSISEVLGKSMAEKIAASPTGTLTGDGLSVGGEGMKFFYDQQLQNFVKTYTKKWGATVSEMKLAKITTPVHAVNITDPMRESVLQVGQRLFQETGEGPRGSFDPATFQTMLHTKADASTVWHEMMHLYVEMLMRVGTQPNATAAMKSDVQALMDWFQVSSWSTLTPEERAKHHEAFAYNGEIFLWEGKAPSPELHGVFQRLAAFMRHLYVAIRDQLNAIYHQRFGIDLPMLTPEVRQVFDRMLASSEQIRHEEEVTKMTALFQTQEQAKMNDAEWAAYKELAQAAQDESISSLQTDSLRQMQWLSRAQSKYLKAQQKQHDAVRADVTLAVTVALEEEPIYQAIKWLKTGEMIGTDGERIQADPRRTSKLDRAALDAMYPTDDGRLDTDRLDWSSIKSLTTVGGLHPDVVAEMFGMQSGDSFVRALLMTPPLDEAITAQVDARMLAEFSDLNSPSKIRLAMDAALHTEARARMVAAELRHVAKATKPVRLMVTAAKRAASQFLQTQLIKDVKSSLYLSAERRATARAEKAMRSGESAAVTAALQQRLLNNQLAQEAIRIQQEVDEGLRYAKQLQTPAAKKRIGADHVDQINALLAQYELGSMTLKAISARVSLAQWIDEQLASGVAPDISPQLLKETRQVPYKVLSVQAFRDLMSALKQIDHTGTQSQYLLTAAKNTQFLAAEREMMQGISLEAKGRVADARTPTTDWGRTVQGLKQFGAMHLKSATIARILDGGKDNGPVWTYLIRTANTRGDQETRMNAEATQTLTKILTPFLAKPMGGKGVFFPSVNRSFNRESVLSIALNVGNAGNLQRLLDGEGWTREQIEPILKSLTAEEWGAVQQIWDFMGSYRPMIAAKQRKLYGVEPNWVEPVPFMVGTADGQIVDMYGGYYPVKYDPQASLKAQTQDDADEAAQLLRGAYTSATTNRSFTKPRADEVKGRPLLYTLAGLYNGVNDVIHDLSWHEWLIDANRLLRSPLIDGAIRNQYGPEWTRQLKTWVEAVAAGSRGIQQDGERALSLLRQGISAAGLGFNVTSAALQITGFNQSIVRVGPTWIARGIGRAISNPLALAREVYERSSFMKHRGMTLFRELNELKNMVRGQTRAEQAVRSGAYLMMMKMQQTVDFPTWWGAYEKGLAAGADEDTAVALADQAVIDSQGSGMLKDLSAIERGGPGMKLFTVFYAYMNTVFQMGTTSAMTAQGKGKLASDMLMLFVVPVALTMALKMALHLGDDDEWDWEKIARTFAAEQLSYLMGTMVVVREFSAASKIVTGDETAGRDYAGPAGVRAIVDVHQALKQGFQFEFDTAFRKSSINLIGDLAGLPSAQINRSIDGIEALLEGRTENPLAVVLGVVKKK